MVFLPTLFLINKNKNQNSRPENNVDLHNSINKLSPHVCSRGQKTEFVSKKLRKKKNRVRGFGTTKKEAAAAGSASSSFFQCFT